MGVKGTLHGIVGGDRCIKAVSVETLIMCLGVTGETLSIRVVSAETPIIYVEPRVRAGSGRETTGGSCRATGRPPVGRSKGLSTIRNK